VLAAIDAADEPEPAKTAAAIRAGFLHFTGDPRRIRVLLADPLGTEAMSRRRRRLIAFVTEQMAEQASRFHGVPRDAPLLRSTTYMLAGGLIEMLIAWENGSLKLTVAELIAHATALAAGAGEAAWRIARERAGPAQAAAATGWATGV
jgi:hypothetical protein